jgi:hypothetical protein
MSGKLSKKKGRARGSADRLAPPLLLVLLGVSLTGQAGFFDQIVDSVKQASEQTLDQVISDQTQNDTENAADSAAEAPPPASAAPSPAPTPVYRPESDRTLVLEIQQRLNALGYDAGAPDGLYGPGTRAAIRNFQRQTGLTADGRPSQRLLERLADAREDAAGPATETLSASISDMPSNGAGGEATGLPTPASHTALSLMRLRLDPSWLDDKERLEMITAGQIAAEKHQKGGLYGRPAVFKQADIADREPKFVARKLAPVMRQYLLDLAAGVGPRFVREVPWRRFRYDFGTGTLEFRGLFLREADEKTRASLPPAVKDLALYEIPRSAGAETQFGLATRLESATRLLALDRVLRLDAVPVAPPLAEKVIALDDPVVRLVFNVTGSVGDVLVADVERLEIRSDTAKTPLLALGPDRFPAAVATNAPIAGDSPPVTRSLGETLIGPGEPDMADLLLLRHFPERLDDDYLFTLLQERQRFEATHEDPLWGRFFRPGARTVDRADLDRYGEPFREWTLARAERLNGPVAIRVTRQHVNFDPNANRASITFNSSSSCVNQRNPTSLDAEFAIAVKSTRDECGEKRYSWNRQPELVVALDTLPMPPAPTDAAGIARGFIPMEIVFEVTGKRQAAAAGQGDVLAATLLEVRYYDRDNTLVSRVTPPPVIADQVKDPLLRAKRAGAFGPEVVGLQLGMSIEDAGQAIRSHREVKERFVGKAPFPFDGAYAFVLGDGGEYITLYTIRDGHGERLAALERQVFYLPSNTPPDDAVADSLLKKYGEPTSRREYQGFSMRWSHSAKGDNLARDEAKSTGCQGLVDSPQAMDVFRKPDGNPYVWALPGVDRVWMGPGNGFGLKRDGTTAADMAGCGTEMTVGWSHNRGQAHGPSLWIKLYDAPWMHAEGEARRSENSANVTL